jgi:adenosylmethionine-8-amino-7-oxononanoate aminotransferase
MPTIVAGEGIHVIDDRGRRLLDVASGPFLANLGQGNERVLGAMLDQGRRLTYTYSRTTRHPANARLSEQLAALAGPGFERVHLTSGGSEAVEMALKFLRQHAVAGGQPERHRVISLLPGYHGATTQTLGLNGDMAAPALWGPMTVSSEKIPAPLTFRAESPEAAASASLAALEETILRLGAEQVLAFVMEPIGGQASGVNVPHPSFARGARRICDHYGVRLVFDEIVTAFRTGRFLAAHHDPDARPDVVVLAKGLGAGYAPLGALLAPAALVDALAESTGFVVSHSCDANPIACAAGSAVLDEVVDRDLIGNAARMGARIVRPRGDRRALPARRGRARTRPSARDRARRRPGHARTLPGPRGSGCGRRAARTRPRAPSLLAPPERRGLRRLAPDRASARDRRSGLRRAPRRSRRGAERRDGRAARTLNPAVRADGAT